MKELKENLRSLSDKQLTQLANEMSLEVIPEDALIRKIANESYPHGGDTLMHILGIGPLLSLELATRLEALQMEIHWNNIIHCSISYDHF